MKLGVCVKTGMRQLLQGGEMGERKGIAIVRFLLPFRGRGADGVCIYVKCYAHSNWTDAMSFHCSRQHQLEQRKHSDMDKYTWIKPLLVKKYPLTDKLHCSNHQQEFRSRPPRCCSLLLFCLGECYRPTPPYSILDSWPMPHFSSTP